MSASISGNQAKSSSGNWWAVCSQRAVGGHAELEPLEIWLAEIQPLWTSNNNYCFKSVEKYKMRGFMAALSGRRTQWGVQWEELILSGAVLMSWYLHHWEKRANVLELQKLSKSSILGMNEMLIRDMQFCCYNLNTGLFVSSIALGYGLKH